MATDGSAAVSSERTVSDVAVPSVPNSLSSAHHYVSIKLTSRNFLFWRAQLIPFLHGQRLMGYIDGSITRPSPLLPPSAGETSSAAVASPNPAYSAWFHQDQAILSMIISSLSEEVIPLVLGKTTSMAAWKAIELALASTSRARAVHLLGQLQTVQQGDASVADYLGRVKVLLEDLVLAGRPVTADEMNIYVFRGLRPEFRSYTASLSSRVDPVSLEEMADLLGAQEFALADELSPAVGSVSPVAHAAARRGGGRSGRRGGQQWRGGGQRGGSSFASPSGSHGQQWRGGGAASQQAGQSRGGRGWRGGRGGGGSRGALFCQICGLQGHSAVTCYRRYSDGSQAHMVYQNVPDSGAPFTSQTWFPDTGATDHATPDDRAFTTAEEYTGSDSLRVGNGYPHQSCVSSG